MISKSKGIVTDVVGCSPINWSEYFLNTFKASDYLEGVKESADVTRFKMAEKLFVDVSRGIYSDIDFLVRTFTISTSQY